MLIIVSSKGSVVVNYLLEMLNDDSAGILSTVQNAIIENNGTFAGYEVDVDTIDASGTTFFRWFISRNMCLITTRLMLYDHR